MLARWLGMLMALVCALGCALGATSASACPVCIDLPEATLADRVLEGDVAVLARENPERPFRFEIVEIVHGDGADLETLPDIPYLLSSTNRRILAANPQSTVLLSYGPLPQLNGTIRPERVGWNKLGVMTPARRVVLDEVLLEGEAWIPRATVDTARFAFFADLITHPDKQIRDMALAEISRAPYELIRTLSDPAPTVDLLQRINRRYEVPFAPVAALLLGLNSDDVARARVRDGFSAALQHGSYIAGAWTVAAIELDREDAVDRIGQRLRDAEVPMSLRGDLVLALTVSGTAMPEMRAGIADVLSQEVRRNPEEIGNIALALYQWRDWALYDHFRALLANERLPESTRYILDAFVQEAQADLLASMSDGTQAQNPDIRSMNH